MRLCCTASPSHRSGSKSDSSGSVLPTWEWNMVNWGRPWLWLWLILIVSSFVHVFSAISLFGSFSFTGAVERAALEPEEWFRHVSTKSPGSLGPFPYVSIHDLRQAHPDSRVGVAGLTVSLQNLRSPVGFTFFDWNGLKRILKWYSKGFCRGWVCHASRPTWFDIEMYCLSSRLLLDQPRLFFPQRFAGFRVFTICRLEWSA